MATPFPKSTSKPTKHGAVVLGRSAMTGQFVLKPASSRSSVSIKDVSTAIKSVSGKKK
jgi:hypothetical protein